MIEVKNLKKNYSITQSKGLFKKERLEIEALKNISFTIKEGECVGYVGPNGAGKSTTLKILSGILYPSSGTVEVDGFIPWRDRKNYVRKVGVLFGNSPQLWSELTPYQSYNLLKKIYGVTNEQFLNELDFLLDSLNVKDLIDRPLRQLSLGQRMRCETIGCFLHSPSVVFLDEPTIGLDVESKHKIRQLLKKVNKEKKITILFTSHDLYEIEANCERIMIINNGELVIDESLSKVKKLFVQKRKISIEVRQSKNLNEINDYLEKLSDIVISKYDLIENKIEFEYHPDDFDIQGFLSIVNTMDISNMVIEDSDFEQAVLDIYRGIR